MRLLRSSLRTGLVLVVGVLAFQTWMARTALNDARSSLAALRQANAITQAAVASQTQELDRRRREMASEWTKATPKENASRRLDRIAALLLLERNKSEPTDPARLGMAYRMARMTGSGWRPSLVQTDPEYGKDALVSLRYQDETQWARLLQRYASEGVDGARFVDILLAATLAGQGYALSSDGTITTSGDGKPLSDWKTSVEGLVRASLGEQAAEEFREEQKALSGYFLADQFQTRLSYTATAMSDQQYMMFARLMASMPPQHILEGRFTAETLESAKAFLSADQIAQLADMNH